MAQCSSRCCRCAELQISQLTAPQSASKQDGENRTVTFAFERIWVRRLPEAASLVSYEPISESHTQLLDALDTPDTRCQFGAEQACVGSLVGQPTNSGKSPIDCARCEPAVLEVNP